MSSDVVFLRRGIVENLGQVAALEPFHDDEIEIAVSVEVYETHDVRMYQAAALGGFLLQRAQRLAVAGQLG